MSATRYYENGRPAWRPDPPDPELELSSHQRKVLGLLRMYNGNRLAVARHMGCSYNNVYETAVRIEEHGVPTPPPGQRGRDLKPRKQRYR